MELTTLLLVENTFILLSRLNIASILFPIHLQVYM